MATPDADRRAPNKSVYSRLRHAIGNDNINDVNRIIVGIDELAKWQIVDNLCRDLDHDLTHAFALMLALAHDPDTGRAHARAHSLGIVIDHTQIRDLDHLLTEAMICSRTLLHQIKLTTERGQILDRAQTLVSLLSQARNLNSDFDHVFKLAFIERSAKVIVRVLADLA